MLTLYCVGDYMYACRANVVDYVTSVVECWVLFDYWIHDFQFLPRDAYA